MGKCRMIYKQHEATHQSKCENGVERGGVEWKGVEGGTISFVTPTPKVLGDVWLHCTSTCPVSHRRV